MTAKIYQVNDYNFIIPHSHQYYGIDFKILVQTHFNIPEDDDLILCLIEMVTVRNNLAIGEKFLYSTHNEQEAKSFLEKYDSIIKKNINHFKDRLSEFGIAGFKNFYTYNSIFITKKNLRTYTGGNHPTWKHEPSKEQKDTKEYGAVVNTLLTFEDIKCYLDYYVSLLEDELGFSNYPSYCIIVRPIGVAEGEDIIPLGILFLHFATKKEYSENFYVEFVNKYLIVWLKNKGYEIVNHFIKSKDDRKDKNILPYLPNFAHTKSPKKLENLIMKTKNNLKEYYTEYFETHHIRFKDKCLEIATYLIPRFLNSQKIKKTELLDIVEKDGKFFQYSGIGSLKVWDLEKFESILFRREIFKIGYIICDLDPYAMLRFFQELSIEKNKDFHRMYSNFWGQLFIPWVQDVDYPNRNSESLKEKIILANSKIEKELIQCYEQIKLTEKSKLSSLVNS